MRAGLLRIGAREVMSLSLFFISARYKTRRGLGRVVRGSVL